ncbi:MAG: chromate transporter [Patescibacteria group bacterium]|nr:chromate transporter [Patescibacteria group bacterium]
MQKELNKLIVPMEGAFSSLPALPKGFKDFIVAIAPWLSLVFGALGLLGSLAALGIVTFLSPAVMMGAGAGAAAGLTLSVILALASSILTLVAVPGLFNRKIAGWSFIFLSEIVSVVSSVVVFSIVGILFSLVGFYILFQVKSYYK